jgi:hypothetical protein
MARGKHRSTPAPTRPKLVPAHEAKRQPPYPLEPTPAEALYPIMIRIDTAATPLEALQAAVYARQTIDQVIAGLVGVNRGHGATWEQIASVLGVRRQAVWQRYGTSQGMDRTLAERGRMKVELEPAEFRRWEREQNRAARREVERLEAEVVGVSEG